MNVLINIGLLHILLLNEYICTGRCRYHKEVTVVFRLLLCFVTVRYK